MSTAPAVARLALLFDDSLKGGPLAAIITHVHGPNMVNLAVFDANGVASGRTSVHFVQSHERPPAGPHALYPTEG